ncbi:MAG: winged helix-turn-helix domain-containing protein [Rhodothermales bacterium]
MILEPAEARLMLVEDDVKLGELVRKYLASNGFAVEIEERGDLAVERIISEQPDMVILDILLPGLDGLSVCKEIRSDYAGPILMLTAKSDEIDEIIGLEVGADDYMSKPVRPRLLLARIRSLLRRVSRPQRDVGDDSSFGIEQYITLGQLTIDSLSRLVVFAGEHIDLTTAEFDLLYMLALSPGAVFSRDELYRELRGIEWDGLDRSIDLRIARLRKKIGDSGKTPEIIKSVRGKGYLLVVNP